MRPPEWIRTRWAPRLEGLRLSLAEPDPVFQLALLGMLSGFAAGAAMVAFRWMVEGPQTWLLAPGGPEDYESLAPLWRLALPTAGGLALGLIFARLQAQDRQVGVVHVMERLTYHDGHLPLKNAVVQFLGAAWSIGCGHSVGREGPSIHIGAACASWLGHGLRLPHTSIRVLVGCGTAGAIGAAFNTPLAGVIFAMEVVMAEYTIANFTPIILAAVVATAISRLVFGDAPAFAVPEFWLGSVGDLVYVVITGIVVGALSAAFVRLLSAVSVRFGDRPVERRLAAAGLLTGLIALAVPEIMGIGYDTVDLTLAGGVGLGAMLVILLCKLLATAVGLGLGIPGGLIGPTLVMGALGGGAVGAILAVVAPGNESSPSFYAMLGMGAMMGATLNAPLAALTALLELTANPHVILPGMLAIVSAEITSQRLFRTPSVFLKMMQARGLSYTNDPVSQFLRRLSVARFMDRKVIRLPRRVERAQLEKALGAEPTWILVEDAGKTVGLMVAEDLARGVGEKLPEVVELTGADTPPDTRPTASISAQATLLGALRRMKAEGVDALYVLPAEGGRILGVITLQQIERTYRSPLG